MDVLVRVFGYCLLGNGSAALDVDGLYLDTYYVVGGEALRIYDLETGNLCVELFETF